jgi:benzoate/toluate 1,2-dioxygenase beta subunit
MTISRQEVEEFLYREARYLDDRDWGNWLALYAPNVEFWMPAWDDDDRLTEDPQTEISLMYYPSKQGLEDRIFRIRTDRSSATSLPEPRTLHHISNVEILAQSDDKLEIRFNWTTQNFRYKTTDTHYGVNVYTLDVSGGQMLISRKKIMLVNDYIHHVIDIYHV